MVDILQGHYYYGGQTFGAWLNTGNGWSYASQYIPPALIAGRDWAAPGG